MHFPAITIEGPDWLEGFTDWTRPLANDEERMRLAVALSRENVERRTGGPFGAIVVERESGRVVGAGTNSVVRLNNSALHAEVMACMVAQRRLESWTLNAPRLAAHELVTSCEPCAMCLGAAFWSGVRRIVCGASREDATTLAFDEGPVFPESWSYLAARGVTVTRGVLHDEARAVLKRYRETGGLIYNA